MLMYFYDFLTTFSATEDYIRSNDGNTRNHELKTMWKDADTAGICLV
jgi:pullulanase/glycogen debranching enzyme